MEKFTAELEALMEAGLTKYEAQACLALYAHGALTPSELSERSGVPKSWVYSVLRSLEEKGWVEHKGGRPRLYVAIHPDTLLPRLRRQLWDSLESKLKIIEGLGSMQKGDGEPISALVYFGEKEVLSKASQLVSVTKSYTLMVNPKWLTRISIPEHHKVLVTNKQHSLIIMDDSLFWFVIGEDFPVIGVLAYSQSLAKKIMGYVEDLERRGLLAPSGQHQQGSEC
jgi:sugar-specific transcriptional regulator TrmB